MSNPDVPSREGAIALFCRLLQVDPAPQVRAYAAIALGKLGRNNLMAAGTLFRAAEEDSSETVRLCAAEAIVQIYGDRPSDPLNQLIQVLNAMSDQPKVQMNFNAPVTNAIGNVEGDLVINPPDPQITNATEQLKTLLAQLRQKYPNATDEQLFQVLLQGFDTMPQRNLQNWQRWRDVLSVFFAGGIEAGKVLLPEVGIPIEVGKRLYEIYDRHKKQLPEG